MLTLYLIDVDVEQSDNSDHNHVREIISMRVKLALILTNTIVWEDFVIALLRFLLMMILGFASHKMLPDRLQTNAEAKT